MAIITVADSFVGVLMLDTQFPRPKGDIGNPATFERLGIPVRYAVVPQVWPSYVLSPAIQTSQHSGEQWEPVFEAFLAAALRLQSAGACLIATSCGFLVLFQHRLSEALRVPVIASSLANAARVYEGKRVGILTISAESLGTNYLSAAGLPLDTPVVGVRVGSEFHASILSNSLTMDRRQSKKDVVEAALRMIQLSPDIDTILLECTNMAPYTEALRRVTGRRVEHIIDHIELAWRFRVRSK
jgi:aspartate/glutamate racemase